ncbi:winged helix-turn-helix transcriptional regulator, partial [bacterium]|nr:winged helix-turn-helix transcriptional regulator [bacterium]
NEKTRVENEKTRVENEKTRVENEKTRVENEKTRVENEKTRVENEKTRAKILNLIKENPYITAVEMAEVLFITEKGLEWQLKKLRDENIIRHIGPKKGGYWEIIE